MTKYRNALPQARGAPFLMDGGLETTMIFHEGIDLPYFAAFTLLDDPKGRAVLEAYFERYLAIAKAVGIGYILDSPTWRANADWGEKLGYGRDRLAALNKEAIAMLMALRAAHESAETPIVVSGNIGPRGDGYDPSLVMTVEEARAYHALQAGAFAEAGADMINA
ncbi:MAG: homocysteine methyltransferase, partial [Rhodospirillaceae bacterium]|nr:homocysteine methyltransferase [Rhodospirillaceae bacterium]